MICWGGGVNSTAIIALYLLGKLPGKPEVVFADTGCEWPETYEYIAIVREILVKQGWKVTILSPVTHRELYQEKIKESTLYDHLWARKEVAVPYARHCSMNWKIQPSRRYANGRVRMLGICKDERGRIRESRGIMYPVRNYSRRQCEKLVKAAGLPPASKTGCYLCPFQKKEQWLRLYKTHPGIWDDVVALERRSIYTIFKGRALDEKLRYWLLRRRKKKTKKAKSVMIV